MSRRVAASVRASTTDATIATGSSWPGTSTPTQRELGPQVRHVLGLHADERREQLVVGAGAEGQRDERLARFG